MRTRVLTVVITIGLILPLLSGPTSARLNSATLPATPNVGVVANIPAPEDVLGFVPGDDRKLASSVK